MSVELVELTAEAVSCTHPEVGGESTEASATVRWEKLILRLGLVAQRVDPARRVGRQP